MTILTHIDFEVDDFGEFTTGPQTLGEPEWAPLGVDDWAWLSIDRWAGLLTG